MESEVIILTLSEKWGNKCVVAYDIKKERLIRLVSEPKFGSGIPDDYVQNLNLLDIIKVRIIQYCPIEHQSENVLVDLTYRLNKVGFLPSINRLAFLENKKSSIFGDCNYKLNDVSHLNHSIEIIKFNRMTFAKNEKGKTKAVFMYKGKLHANYSVTDSRYFTNSTPIDAGFAIISLPPSDAFTRNGGGYFKYVAAIH